MFFSSTQRKCIYLHRSHIIVFERILGEHFGVICSLLGDCCYKLTFHGGEKRKKTQTKSLPMTPWRRLEFQRKLINLSCPDPDRGEADMKPNLILELIVQEIACWYCTSSLQHAQQTNLFYTCHHTIRDVFGIEGLRLFYQELLGNLKQCFHGVNPV